MCLGENLKLMVIMSLKYKHFEIQNHFAWIFNLGLNIKLQVKEKEKIEAF